MKRTIVLCFLIILCIFSYAHASAECTIQVTRVEQDTIQGRVVGPEAPFVIAVYFDSGRYYISETDADGTFLLPNHEGVTAHIMVIQAPYTPSFDANVTRNVALCELTLKKNGTHIAKYYADQECGDVEEEYTPRAIQVDIAKIAVNVGFYTKGAYPGDPLDPETMSKQLDAVTKIADTVRFYASSGELYKAYAMANQRGLKVIGTAWLSGVEEADKQEMDALIEHANRGMVSVACVGSETLLRGSLTSDDLISCIEYVRSGITRDDVAVTTADTLPMLMGNKEIVEHCSLLFPNFYPFWNGISIDNAMQDFSNAMEALQTKYPDKPVIVSESGWPTRCDTITDETCAASAVQFVSDLLQWSLEMDVPICLFEAFDEAWKTSAEGIPGGNWGLMDENLCLKEAYVPLFTMRLNKSEQ